MNKKYLSCFILLAFLAGHAQVTTGGINGKIKTNTGDPLVGAIITVIHEPTGAVYRVQSHGGGLFHIDYVNPGGPYSIEASFIGFTGKKIRDVFLNLGESYRISLFLSPQAVALTNVTVTGFKKNTGDNSATGFETVIGPDQINDFPSAGRNIYDYLRCVPRVKTVDGNDGAISIAGQNNRYNSFYIDGAINNDVFGLAGSGTNGGQTGAPPISVDALEQLQIVVSPYDASYGNFTGGGINAVTRSGSNKNESSVYYFYSNQPPMQKDVNEDGETISYTGFTNKTYGSRVSGAFTKNKLFYFLNIEEQVNEAQQVFNTNTYTGNTNSAAGLQGLADLVKKAYRYDIGNYFSSLRSLHADRFVCKIDYNISNKHKLSFSYRYNHSEAVLPGSNTTTVIHFSNDGIFLPNRTISFSGELKSLGKRINNKLLITYSDVKDDRSFINEPFPRVSITDGAGSIVFGSEPNSTQNLLLQKNAGLFDIVKFQIRKHFFSAGIDLEYMYDQNVFIQNSFGNYHYGSVAAFESNAAPLSYERGISLPDNNLTDHTKATAKFNTLKTAFFISDELHTGEQLTFSFGLRADRWTFLSAPVTDPFFNDAALPKLAQYYDLKGAGSGTRPVFPIILSPRFGFVYKIPEKNITLSGGAGIFSGRMPLAWPGGIYSNNGLFIGSLISNNTSLNAIRFRWNGNDPAANAWYANNATEELTKGSLNLVSAKFHMPALWRTSFSVDKKTTGGWHFTGEAMFSKNIYEINYTNVNILPPNSISNGAGARNVYAAGNINLPARIPLTANNSNPYENVILLSNNDSGSKGFSYHFIFTAAKKTTSGISFNVNYSFGRSMVWHEGTSSVNTSQWIDMESVNGRNYPVLSVSDFSPAHTFFLHITKKILYAHKRMSTTFAFIYTGRSGTPVSYVYSGKSVVGDAGTEGFYDLIYIPTKSDLAATVFLPNTINGITYTPQQQKNAFDTYITNDTYLNTHRGRFAERNGSRLPFSHSVDIKITQDLTVRTGASRYHIQFTWDVFNLLNLVNKAWGQIYDVPFNQVALVRFAGYTGSLVPQYRFDPTLLISSPIQHNAAGNPANNSFWASQIGVRITLN